MRLDETGSKHVHHPVLDDLHVNYETMEVPGQPGLLLIAFTTPAGSPDEDALRMLSSWAATQAREQEASPAEHQT